MKRPARVLPFLIFLMICFMTIQENSQGMRYSPEGSSSRDSTAVVKYVCTPCGSPCGNAVYDKPGVCAKCGMPLVPQKDAEAVTARPRKKVAILIFDGVQIIDYAGPYELFGAADYDVYTVAETKQSLTTAMGMTVVPNYSFADMPQPDVLVVPGGAVHGIQQNPAILKWLKSTAERAENAMSVCNGAFILASAGMLDGLTATTTSSNIERLRAEFPKITVVANRRYVDNGKIITTAGLAAGMDGALHVISKMSGNGFAQEVALGEEYDWRPRSGFARAALADRLIPDIGNDLDSMGKWNIANTEGKTDRWEISFHGTSDSSAGKLMDRLGNVLSAKGKWMSIKSEPPRPVHAMSSDWKFSGSDGRPWHGTLSLQTASGKAHEYTLKIVIARNGK